MNLKMFFAMLLLLGCLTTPLTGSEEPEESGFVKTTKTACEVVKKCKNTMLGFVKNHPFIALSIAGLIVSKNLRDTAVGFPNELIDFAKHHPFYTILIGGVLFQYFL